MAAIKTNPTCKRCGQPRIRQNRRYCSKSCEFADRQEPDAILKRFLRFVKKTDTCWLWLGAKTNGYGASCIRGKTTLAHRIAYELATGQIPPSTLDVCHACDVPLCVRPEHLFLGTRRDNVQDMIQKGRCNWATGDKSSARLHPESRPRGEQYPQSKLTADIVRTIRYEHAQGAGIRALGRRFNVAHNTIGAVVHRRAWTHVT
jgi:hypothetical protein